MLFSFWFFFNREVYLMSSRSLTRGYVYVANTEAYLQEAVRSSKSLKEAIPSAQVALIAPESLWACADDAFDFLIKPRLSDRTPIVKNDAPLAPFDEVAFVDTDTRFLGDHSSVFDVLGAFDIAAAHEPTRGWDYPTKAPNAFCELNTGLLVFRNSVKVREFFELWLANYRKMLAEYGLRNDQPSFRQALWGSPEIRLAVLPSEFHAIVGKPCSIAWEALLIHGRDDLERTGHLINYQLGYRAYLPGIGCSYPFAGRRQLIRDWLRLNAGIIKGLLRPSRYFGPPDTAGPTPHRWYLGETDSPQ